MHTKRSGMPSLFQDPTTSFLTATTQIYVIGARIFAVASPKLAVKWILVKGIVLLDLKLAYTLNMELLLQSFFWYILIQVLSIIHVQAINLSITLISKNNIGYYNLRVIHLESIKLYLDLYSLGAQV